jgi:hypothetical protein
MTKDANDNRWVTAVHEAAHVVVGMHYNAIVSYAEVLVKTSICERMLGCVSYYDDPDDDGVLPTFAAGRLAEHLVDGSKPRRVEPLYLHGLMASERRIQVSAMRLSGLSFDQEQMMHRLCDRGLKDPIGAFHRVEKATWALVQELRPQIMVVANALYDRGRLDCADIDEILEEHGYA